jgi:hypothetical protein
MDLALVTNEPIADGDMTVDSRVLVTVSSQGSKVLTVDVGKV